MEDMKDLKSEHSTLLPMFNNQFDVVELVEVKASPPFEETLPERDQHGFPRNKGTNNVKLELSI